MSAVALLLLASILPAADDKKTDKKEPKKPDPAAKVTITAEIACLHCTFGQGNSCAVCLALDEKTPVLLAGNAAKRFEDDRLSKKVLVAEGVLSMNKDRRLVLTTDDAHFQTDKDAGKSPEKGQVKVVGLSCCGHCDLGLTDDCAVAITNATLPIVLEGKLATEQCDEAKEKRTATSVGRLYLDKKGVLKLDATKLNLEKKEK